MEGCAGSKVGGKEGLRLVLSVASAFHWTCPSQGLGGHTLGRVGGGLPNPSAGQTPTRGARRSRCLSPSPSPSKNTGCSENKDLGGWQLGSSWQSRDQRPPELEGPETSRCGRGNYLPWGPQPLPGLSKKRPKCEAAPASRFPELRRLPSSGTAGAPPWPGSELARLPVHLPHRLSQTPTGWPSTALACQHPLSGPAPHFSRAL